MKRDVAHRSPLRFEFRQNGRSKYGVVAWRLHTTRK